MASIRDELPLEGDEAEAQDLVERNPIRLPTYRLERVHVATLNVDYAPPEGTGYARPLSRYRLAQLRRDWDPLAVSPLTLSRRPDSTLWVIDGNHRRYIAYEKGMLQLPAMVHSGLERTQEADLYTKLGTVLGQTPWTRFLAKLASEDEHAADIVKIAQRFNIEINGGYAKSDGKIQAVARVEGIYARGGPEGLDWVFGMLADAFYGERDSLTELALEGAFSFYIRYADLVQRSEVSDILRGSGVNAWYDRAASIEQRIDIGTRGSTFGLAIAEMVNDTWRRRGKRVRELLPAWEKNPNMFGSRYREASTTKHALMQWRSSSSARGNLAPQQLGS